MAIVVKFQRIRMDAKSPERASNGAVGYDVYASRVLDEKTKNVVSELPFTITPGGKVLVGIGVKIAVPWPYQCEVRPRSGLANRYDIELSNSPGTIDPDFRGEAGVLLRNRGEHPFSIKKDMRVAQLVFSMVEIPVIKEAEELPATTRGAGGFGSTGLFGIREGTREFDAEVRREDEFFMRIALQVAARSNCVRGAKKDEKGLCPKDGSGRIIGATRNFGCVIVKDGNIVSMGYNSQYRGSPLCENIGCLREAENIPTGTKIERCRAMHAEWMAITKLLVCGSGVSTIAAAIYLTAQPCEVCAKLIVGAEIGTMVLLEGAYPTNGEEILRNGGVEIRYVKI